MTQGSPSTFAAMLSKMGFMTSQVESRTAGHDGRAFARAFLTAGNAGTDEAETLARDDTRRGRSVSV